MNVLPFIVAAYAVAIVGIGGVVVQSWVAMRRAERAVESLRRGE